MENKTEQFLSKGAVREMTALSTSTSVNGSGVCQAAAYGSSGRREHLGGELTKT